MISASQISKFYPGGRTALDQITFAIHEGELVFLSGHSGAGKSTLLKLIAGVESPSRGMLSVMGVSMHQLRRQQLPALRRDMGLVFQDHKLLHDRNLVENVILPLQIMGLPYREALKRVHAALDKVGLLQSAALKPSSLSGGEQQRLAIARAIVHRPALILADEPTGNLDADHAREILALLLRFHAVGTTLLIATHDPNLLAHTQARQLHLSHGRLMA